MDSSLGVFSFRLLGIIMHLGFAANVDFIFPYKLFVHRNRSSFKVHITPFKPEDLAASETGEQAEYDTEHHKTIRVAHGLDETVCLFLSNGSVLKYSGFGNADTVCRVMSDQVVLNRSEERRVGKEC